MKSLAIVAVLGAVSLSFAAEAEACTSAEQSFCLQTYSAAATTGPNGRCQCVRFDWTPRQVVNAADGDVGLVSIFDGRGNEIVRTALAGAGQNHRHSVLFFDAGRRVRHSDFDSSTVRVRQPAVGAVKLDPDELRNGLPGFADETVDRAFDRGALSEQGLVLRPANDRMRTHFTRALSLARAASGYYKLADYTDLTSMTLSWSATRSGDLRGTHCSGLVAWAFTAAGTSLSQSVYSESLRQQIAEDVHGAILAQAEAATGWFADFYHPNAAENVANQVTNCFAGLGCASVEPLWEGGVGDGLTVSPDNLLPRSFTLSGSASYTWDGAVRSPGSTLSNADGALRTPFQRVEAMQLAGGYFTAVVLYTFA